MNNSEISPRSCMYRLLSGFYARELSPNDIENFQSKEMSKLLNALAKIKPYDPVINRLKVFFDEITDVNQAALDLAESYAWLFHGVAGIDAAPPVASVYLSQNRNAFQEPEAAFFELLQKYDLSAENYEKEPCDHLSIILEFISWLDRQAELTQDPYPWISEQIAVIHTYLLSWLPEFVQKCRQGDLRGFYADLAADTLAFAAEDARQLAVLHDKMQAVHN